MIDVRARVCTFAEIVASRVSVAQKESGRAVVVARAGRSAPGTPRQGNSREANVRLETRRRRYPT